MQVTHLTHPYEYLAAHKVWEQLDPSLCDCAVWFLENVIVFAHLKLQLHPDTKPTHTSQQPEELFY